MKKFVNAEVVELELKATAEAREGATTFDADRKDDGTTDWSSVRPGVPYPSGSQDAQYVYVP